MKSLTQLFILSLASALLLISSCTVEKRTYMSGYHIEWNKIKHDKDKLASSEKGKSQNKNTTVEQSETATDTTDNFLAPSVIEENMTASVDDERFILADKEKFNLFSVKTKVIPNEEKQINRTHRSKLKKHTKIISSPSDETRINGLALAGFITSLVGFLLMFTIVGALVLGILGTVFSAIGLTKTGKDKMNGRGFAVAGLVIGIVDILAFLLVVAIVLTIFL